MITVPLIHTGEAMGTVCRTAPFSSIPVSTSIADYLVSLSLQVMAEATDFQMDTVTVAATVVAMAAVAAAAALVLAETV